MIDYYLHHGIPRECEELKAVSSKPNQREWDYITQPWAVPWELLSLSARQALVASIPQVHNQLYSYPSWPGGLCNKACELLAISLANKGIEVMALNGLYSIEVEPGSSQGDIHQMIRQGRISEQALDYGNHSWLEVEGLLVDPTAGQFLGPRAWDGEFDDDQPWSLECYFPSSYHSGPFGEGWFDSEGWQEVTSGHYQPDWRCR